MGGAEFATGQLVYSDLRIVDLYSVGERADRVKAERGEGSEVVQTALAMLHMPGMTAADIDLSAGMAAR